MKAKKYSLLIVLAIFIGAVGGLIIASNLQWTPNGVAADSQEKAKITLGSSEPVSEDLMNLRATSKAFVEVAKTVSPAVVTINSQKVVKRRNWHPFMDDDFFRRFFRTPESEEQVLRGLGSGVIINPDGYIITNNHVIEGADEITVSLDDKEYDAKIIGRDPDSDIAIIKIDKQGLPTIKLGDSEELEVGEWVLAIGNPFSDVFQRTVTAGIVSAKGRRLDRLGGGSITYQDFIQTDAAINPGNSGGALVNLQGELIGINTAIVGQTNVGIGFAIPIDLARNVMEQLINEGRVIRGWLGVYIDAVDDNVAAAFGWKEAKGVQVLRVQEDSPAEKAGIKATDIILKVNDTEINDPNELTNLIASYAPKTKVDLTVWREDKEMVISVKLGERPTEVTASSDSSSEDNLAKLGLEVQDLTSSLAQRYGYEEEGVLVAGVRSGSPADRERIREGDLIVSVDKKAVKSVRELKERLSGFQANEIVLFRLKRGEMSFFRALRLPKEEK
jgi:serine protease Do